MQYYAYRPISHYKLLYIGVLTDKYDWRYVTSQNFPS
jgi:hypothetical protein